jgi:hypothetical protein
LKLPLLLRHLLLHPRQPPNQLQSQRVLVSLVEPLVVLLVVPSRVRLWEPFCLVWTLVMELPLVPQ